jgi:hypothetical protein
MPVWIAIYGPDHSDLGVIASLPCVVEFRCAIISLERAAIFACETEYTRRDYFGEIAEVVITL